MLAETGFNIEGATDLSSRYVETTTTDGDTIVTVTVSFEEISQGRFSLLHSLMQLVDLLNWNLMYPMGLTSTSPGMFAITVTGAPKSLDESIKDAQFTRSFEAEIGEGRFKSLDAAISGVGLTRDEALQEIKGLQETRDDIDESVGNDNILSNIPYKIADLSEIDYRWEIGWLQHSVTDNSTDTLLSLLPIYQNLIRTLSPDLISSSLILLTRYFHNFVCNS